MFVCPECAKEFLAAGFCTEHGAELASRADNPLLGQVVGSYRIARLLGRGGMGEVYLGVHPTIGSRVAIKVLTQAAAENENLVERFFAEARAVNVIRHESIVNVLDLAQLPDGRPYIVMEFLEGASLGALMASGPLPLGSTLRLMIEVLDALAAAHAAGITHRDLKPDNVFVTSLGRPKVLDFGIAKLRPELGSGSDGTRTGALLGTPHYMSPEQALGRHVDHRSDIYSAGVILFECATGQRPFDAPSLFELLRLQIEAPPPRPRTLRSDLPLALETALLSALEKHPEQRFQSASELSRALEETTRLLPAESFAPLTPASARRAQDKAPVPATVPSDPPRTAPSPYAPPALTAPGVPITKSAFAATLSRESEAKPAKTPWLALGAAATAVVALIGVVGLALVILLVQGGVFASSPGASPTAAPGETSPSAPPPPLPPFTFDKTHFDAGAFFAHAEQRARTHFGDAKLASFSASGIRSDGTIDFTQDGTSTTYLFRSEKASAGVPQTGAGGPRLGHCAASVSATRDGVFDAAIPMFDCAMPIAGNPRCSLKHVMTKASGSEARPPAIVTFNAFGVTGRMWVVKFGKEGSQHIVPDEC